MSGIASNHDPPLPDLGLDRIPLWTYLQHYPFPAGVFSQDGHEGSSSNVHLDPSFGDPSFIRDTENQTFRSEEDLEPIWSNKSWQDLIGQAGIKQNVDAQSLSRFHEWIKPSPSDSRSVRDSVTFDDHDGGQGSNLFDLHLLGRITLVLVKTYIPATRAGGPSYVVVTAMNSIQSDHNATLPGASEHTTTHRKNPLNSRIPDNSSLTLNRSVDATRDLHDNKSKLDPSLLSNESEQSALPATIDCFQLLEQTDWSKTCLGPRNTWSPSINTMIGVVMASETQDSLWLGEDFVMIYNQHYAEIVNHPDVFGRSAKIKEAWGDVWEGVYHLIRQCIDRGTACHIKDDLLLYRRGIRGHYVEKYHTWSFIPIYGLDGKSVLGIYNPTVDSTAAVLAYRRQQITKLISDKVSIARNEKDYFEGIVEAVTDNTKDVPFLMCYSVSPPDETKGGQPNGLRISLERSVGVPEGHPAAPLSIDLTLTEALAAGTINPELNRFSPLIPNGEYDSSDPTWASISYDRTTWPIAQALATRRCVVVDNCAELINGFPLRQWDQLPESAIVMPICSTSSTETPHGVLIMGLNLYCPLDKEYRNWIEVTRSQLASALASVHAYAAEQRRVAEKERLERAKTAWFQGAAHDLRSPLTLVAGPLEELLDSGDLKPQHRATLALAQRNVTRIQRLVNALLDFSRIEAGKLQGRFVPLDLSRYVADLASLFRPAMLNRHLQYEVQLESRERLTFFDPTLMEIVISNLLSNALKYTESGTITVRLIYTAAHAEIAVIDTGVGIPQAELESVTDRFKRASTASSRAIEGTGIGLALAKEMVRLHGGDLIIRSQVAEESHDGSHGSTFTALIPLVSREMDRDAPGSGHQFGSYGKEVAAEALHSGKEAAMFEDVSALTPTTESAGALVDSSNRSESFMADMFDKDDVLLLVDDNYDIRRYVKRMFTPYCKVLEASSGEEALTIARQSPPDLILSDLMMPRMNGQELLQAVRHDPITRLVPMVLLSAATDESSRLSALTSGADDFISKPFKPKELVARIHLQMQLGKRRIKLEALFLQREREISLLSDYCPSGIIRQSADGKMVYGNAAWVDYAGLQDGESLDNWLTRVEPNDAQLLELNLHQFYQGDTRELRQTWKWKSGRIVTGDFIRLDKLIPGTTGVLGCFSDITDREARLQEAERRQAEAEEAKRQQDLLIDFTSHEIRTPVSAILQCSSLVKENLESLRLHLTETPASEMLVGRLSIASLFKDLQEDINALDSIYQCGLVQERIANDVLSLSRIQLDTLDFCHVEINLKTEIQRVVAIFTSEARMKRIDLRVEFGRNVHTVIKTDHVRLGQIITNLVSNAIKFTATSETRRITVRVDSSFEPPSEENCAPPGLSSEAEHNSLQQDVPCWIFICVRDTGPGLSPTERAALFQRFSQGNHMIHSRYGGSGLGLFICKKLTELMGGRIEVESEVGKGSAFRFFIESRTADRRVTNKGGVAPLDSSHTAGSPKDGQVAMQNPVSIGSVISPVSMQTKGAVDEKTINTHRSPHVLIVEDNVINQTILKRQLTKAGFTCDLANDGQEALDFIYSASPPETPSGLGRNRYDAVFMDLEMPVMDGLTAIRIIRANEAKTDSTHTRPEIDAPNASASVERAFTRPARLFVIALTGNARPAQAQEALEAGMDDVIIKPYRLPELIAKVQASRAAVIDRREGS